MTDVARFGILNEDKPVFTKAPLRTPKELDEADKRVQELEEMMGITDVNNSKEAL